MRNAYRSLFAIAILVLLGWAALDGWRLFELTYRTLGAEAIVTRKSALPSGDRTEHRLEFTFLANDLPVSSSAIVTPETFAAATEGGPIRVVYLATDPAEHWIGDNEAARTQPRFMLIARSVAACVALFFLVLIEVPVRRDLWLARHGIVTEGRILATGRGRRKRARPWIRYSFRLADGSVIEGKCSVPRATAAESLTPGRAIEVLLDPANPRRHRARLAMAAIEFSNPPTDAPAHGRAL